MLAQGFGMTCVAPPDGTLEGIITDGELRRQRSADRDVMTTTPITIEGSALAARPSTSSRIGG